MRIETVDQALAAIGTLVRTALGAEPITCAGHHHGRPYVGIGHHANADGPVAAAALVVLLPTELPIAEPGPARRDASPRLVREAVLEAAAAYPELRGATVRLGVTRPNTAAIDLGKGPTAVRHMGEVRRDTLANLREDAAALAAKAAEAVRPKPAGCPECARLGAPVCATSRCSTCGAVGREPRGREHERLKAAYAEAIAPRQPEPVDCKCAPPEPCEQPEGYTFERFGFEVLVGDDVGRHGVVHLGDRCTAWLEWPEHAAALAWARRMLDEHAPEPEHAPGSAAHTHWTMVHARRDREALKLYGVPRTDATAAYMARRPDGITRAEWIRRAASFRWDFESQISGAAPSAPAPARVPKDAWIAAVYDPERPSGTAPEEWARAKAGR